MLAFFCGFLLRHALDLEFFAKESLSWIPHGGGGVFQRGQDVHFTNRSDSLIERESSTSSGLLPDLLHAQLPHSSSNLSHQPESIRSVNDSLCLRSTQDFWLKCRSAIWKRLSWGNLTCPERCVTFSAYGRYNNNMLQLTNMVARFVHPKIGEESRRSILLQEWLEPRLEGVHDFEQLARLCVFPSWASQRSSRSCQVVPGDDAYRYHMHPEMQRSSRKSIHHPSPAPKWKQFEWDLMLAMLLVGSTSRDTQDHVARQIAELTSPEMNFSTVHARFLEGQCGNRHRSLGLSTDICDFESEYVASRLASLGHSEQKLIICSDRQESRKVHAVLKLMNATVSSNSSPLLDFQLMLLSARFLGNRASSMSVNIASLRNTLFHKNAKTLLL